MATASLFMGPDTRVTPHWIPSFLFVLLLHSFLVLALPWNQRTEKVHAQPMVLWNLPPVPAPPVVSPAGIPKALSESKENTTVSSPPVQNTTSPPRAIPPSVVSVVSPKPSQNLTSHKVITSPAAKVVVPVTSKQTPIPQNKNIPKNVPKDTSKPKANAVADKKEAQKPDLEPSPQSERDFRMDSELEIERIRSTERLEKIQKTRDKTLADAIQILAPSPAPSPAPPSKLQMSDEWQALIRSKIREQVPARIASAVSGNPEVQFEVQLLAMREVGSVRLLRSSGNAAYDAAVERAIWAMSPVPLQPDGSDIPRLLILRSFPKSLSQ